MGWLIRYTGKAGDVLVPGEREPRHLKKGDLVDVRPPDVMAAVRDPDQPWERVAPSDPDYVTPADRT